MTDEAKALAEALKRDALTYDQRWRLVDLIETQAREIERLRARGAELHGQLVRMIDRWVWLRYGGKKKKTMTDTSTKG